MERDARVRLAALCAKVLGIFLTINPGLCSRTRSGPGYKYAGPKVLYVSAYKLFFL